MKQKIKETARKKQLLKEKHGDQREPSDKVEAIPVIYGDSDREDTSPPPSRMSATTPSKDS